MKSRSLLSQAKLRTKVLIEKSSTTAPKMPSISVLFFPRNLFKNKAIMKQKPTDGIKAKRSPIFVPMGKIRFDTMPKGSRKSKIP